MRTVLKFVALLLIAIVVAAAADNDHKELKTGYVWCQGDFQANVTYKYLGGVVSKVGTFQYDKVTIAGGSPIFSLNGEFFPLRLGNDQHNAEFTRLSRAISSSGELWTDCQPYISVSDVSRRVLEERNSTYKSRAPLYLVDFVPSWNSLPKEVDVPGLEQLIRDRGRIQTALPSVSSSVNALAAKPKSSVPIVDPIAREPRLALVIGNSDYRANLGSLANPVNDAATIGSVLVAVGFQVQVVRNADQQTMKRAIIDFGARLRAAGHRAIGLFFYAGHGVQTQGVNYLIPVDASITAEPDIDIEAVQADAVLYQMEHAGSGTNIIILDACRNMPLTRSFRDGTRGLARMDAPNGSFIAYSTAPGSVAADGVGHNSPFVTALASIIRTPNQPIEVVFRRVRKAVFEMTQGRQTPWDSSSLISPFYFVGQ